MFTHENFIFWLLSPTAVAGLLTVYGIVSGRTLPDMQKAARIRMFALIGLAVIFFCLPIFKSYVSSYSVVEDLEITNPSGLDSQEARAKHELNQDRNIEKLKTEVNRLRKTSIK